VHIDSTTSNEKKSVSDPRYVSEFAKVRNWRQMQKFFDTLDDVAFCTAFDTFDFLEQFQPSQAAVNRRSRIMFAAPELLAPCEANFPVSNNDFKDKAMLSAPDSKNMTSFAGSDHNNYMRKGFNFRGNGFHFGPLMVSFVVPGSQISMQCPTPILSRLLTSTNSPRKSSPPRSFCPGMKELSSGTL